MPGRFLILAAIWVLAIPSPAYAHTPFKDGKTTARQLQRNLNSAKVWSDVVCRYQRPHILCTGALNNDPLTDVWYRFHMTVHKTGPKKGYALTCIDLLGVCKRQAMSFQT